MENGEELRVEQQGAERVVEERLAPLHRWSIHQISGHAERHTDRNAERLGIKGTMIHT